MHWLCCAPLKKLFRLSIKKALRIVTSNKNKFWTSDSEQLYWLDLYHHTSIYRQFSNSTECTEQYSFKNLDVCPYRNKDLRTLNWKECFYHELILSNYQDFKLTIYHQEPYSRIQIQGCTAGDDKQTLQSEVIKKFLNNFV